MKTIHKFPLQIESKQIIEMPAASEVIHIGLDPAGVPCIWAVVDTENGMTPKEFYVLGTGHELPPQGAWHLGSFVQNAFVWHVFRP